MTTTYCDADDLADILGEAGVSLRLSDVPPEALGRVLVRAAAKVNRYCLRRYTAAKLAASEWVRVVAAEMAAYLLCTRKGNPAPSSVVDLWNMALEDLKLIKAGDQIPDIAARKTGAPVLSNVRVRLRPVMHTRVEQARSTGNPEGYVQRKDRLDPLQYWGGGDFQI